MAAPLLPTTLLPKRSLDERRPESSFDAPHLAAPRSWRSPITKRLATALVAGFVCVLWFSALLPSPSSIHHLSPYVYSGGSRKGASALVQYPTWRDVPPTHLYPLPLDASLDERLETWRNAPGIGWEPADFVAWNLQTCADAIPNHNKDLIAKSSLIWGVMNSTAVLAHRNRMADYIIEQRALGAFESHIAQGGRGFIGQGRGMVFSAGNADTLQRVVVTLKLVRKYYNSTLPAAIFHFPSERPADDDPIHEELAGLNAKLVQSNKEKDPTRTKNWHLKALAMIEAPWAEVIYLDSDNLPTRAPEEFFDQPGYKRLGAMFWVDYWKTSANNPIWHILGVQCRDEWEQEAGQIILDKRRHLDALLLSQYMLNDWQFWFYFSDGDKDIFRFAFLALRKRWALPGRYVGAGALPSGTASGEFCSHTMQQFDNAGRPAFVHYNLLKQIPSGVGRGYSWGRTKQVSRMPTAPLRPLSQLEWETHNWTEATNLTRTEKWWEAGSRPYEIEERYKAYPYPDPEGLEERRGADDVEADMLANAKDDGRAIMPADEEVRRRAAVERGMRPYFHGGVISALCIDFRWEDPHGKPREANTVMTSVDKTAPNELGIDWGISPLEVAQWSDDDYLRDLEDRVYDEGFVPNGKGF